MLSHEIWRDEAQVWCIVRDCNLIDVFQNSRLEGHPVLWYLILMPFAKLGFNVQVMQVISLLFVFASVIFFVFKSSFNNYLKFVIVFSSGMLYYLPVIARNYSLIPLFVFLLANLYHKRHQHPILYVLLIIILSNTHILMLGFCSILSLLFVYEVIKNYIQTRDKKSLISVFILALNFLYLFLSFYNMQNMNHVVVFYSQHSQTLYKAVLNFANLFFLFPLNGLGIINILIFYFLLLSVLIFFFIKSKKIFSIILVSLIYQFYVYYKVWYQGIAYQKTFLFLLILLFCYWVFVKKNITGTKLISIIIGIFFTFSFIFSFFSAVLEIKYPFSAGKQVADYIKENLKDCDTLYAVGAPFLYTSISAYLPDKKLYSYMNDYYISYYSFSYEGSSDIQKNPDTKYYIFQTDFIADNTFQELFATDKDIITFGEYNEIFKIYKKN